MKDLNERSKIMKLLKNIGQSIYYIEFGIFKVRKQNYKQQKKNKRLFLCKCLSGI